MYDPVPAGGAAGTIAICAGTRDIANTRTPTPGLHEQLGRDQRGAAARHDARRPALRHDE